MDLVGDEQDAPDFVGVATVDQMARMQATAADVAIRGDRDAVARADLLDRAERLRNTGDGDADVFATIRPIGARSQGPYGCTDHRACLPQRVDARRLI